MRKLTALNAAPSLNALRVPPGNHLEALGGEREGQASVSMTSGAYVLSGMREMHMMSKSSIITRKREDRMVEEKMAPIHPGEILKEDFIAPMGISQYL